MNDSFNSSTCNSSTFNCTSGILASTNFTLWHQVIGVVLSVCSLLGLPGNIGVIVVICRDLRRPNLSMKLFLSLAISDLLCLLFWVPFFVYAILCSWDLGNSVCKLTVFFGSLCRYSSSLNILLICIQRYVQVVHPQKWARLCGTRKIWLLVGVWGGSIAFSLPAVAHKLAEEEDRRLHCLYIYRPYGGVAVFVGEILGFVFFISILLTLYLHLQKRVSESAFSRNPRMTKLVTRILVTYVICSIPSQVINILQVSAMLAESQSLYDFCERNVYFVRVLRLVTCCLNPFLYAFSTRNFCQKSGTSDTERQLELDPQNSPPNM